MIDLISVARPVLVDMPSEQIPSVERVKALLWIEFLDLVHIDVHLHRRRGCEDE